MLADAGDWQLIAIFEAFFYIVCGQACQRTCHLHVLAAERQDVGTSPEDNAEVTVEAAGMRDVQKWHQFFRNAYRTAAGAASAVRGGKGLMEI